ncbi:hypothetical protein L2E82_08543 [Cichorium intybus]|uniref:Uncharacterized protein n=1 Tax=Cichorium intybus TaxID=13427 RepID=A0ACB9G7Q5_CICIN|nr:hypothetical protein L2E82_08543 [Cichorium intybus]
MEKAKHHPSLSLLKNLVKIWFLKSLDFQRTIVIFSNLQMEMRDCELLLLMVFKHINMKRILQITDIQHKKDLKH